MSGANGEALSLLASGSIASADLAWLHATGFNAGTYRPLLKRMADDLVMALDARGHGHSTTPANPRDLRSWDQYYRDFVSFLDALDHPIAVAGHSIGATTVVFAAAARPKKVAALVLMEPVLIDPLPGLGFGLLKHVGVGTQTRLAQGAARRRSEFPSLEAAYQTYRSRQAFKAWPDEWLQAYVRAGFRRQAAGGVVLRCAPAWESRTFAVTEHWPWRAVAKVQCPTTVLAGATRFHLPPARASCAGFCIRTGA